MNNGKVIDFQEKTGVGVVPRKPRQKGDVTHRRASDLSKAEFDWYLKHYAVTDPTDEEQVIFDLYLERKPTVFGLYAKHCVYLDHQIIKIHKSEPCIYHEQRKEQWVSGKRVIDVVKKRTTINSTTRYAILFQDGSSLWAPWGEDPDVLFIYLECMFGFHE